MINNVSIEDIYFFLGIAVVIVGYISMPVKFKVFFWVYLTLGIMTTVKIILSLIFIPTIAYFVTLWATLKISGNDIMGIPDRVEHEWRKRHG